MPAAPRAELEKQIQDLQAEVDRLSNPTDRLVLGRCEECAFIVSVSGDVQYVSPNIGRIFCGKSTESMEGQPISKILGDWVCSVLPADPHQASTYTRQIEDAQGEPISLHVIVESIKSEIGPTLIQCRRIGEVDMKDVAKVQRERYQRLVEGLNGKGHSFFFGADKTGKLTYVSRSIEDVLGYQPNQVVGKNWRDFVDSQHEQNGRVEELERRRFAGLDNPAHEIVVNDAHGRTRRVEVLDIAIVDKEGQVVESEGICRDTTDSRDAEQATREELERAVAERTAELRHASQLYKSVVDVQTEFIVRWLPDGTRTFVNPAYCEYARKSPQELLGRPVSRMQNPRTRETYDLEIRKLTPSNPSLIHEVSFIDEAGRQVWQQWHDQALFDATGKLIEIQSVGRDVTAKRSRLTEDQKFVEFRLRLQSLSPRERQVMDLVTAGNANKVIASQLQLSVKTVEKHRSSMMRKLEVQSVAQLVRSVIRVEGN